MTTTLTFAQEMKARVVDDNDFPVGGYLSASSPIHIDGVTQSNPKTIMYDLLERDYNEK